MENQKMPEYETIRAAVAGEKWAVEKVVAWTKSTALAMTKSVSRTEAPAVVALFLFFMFKNVFTEDGQTNYF